MAWMWFLTFLALINTRMKAVILDANSRTNRTLATCEVRQYLPSVKVTEFTLCIWINLRNRSLIHVMTLCSKSRLCILMTQMFWCILEVLRYLLFSHFSQQVQWIGQTIHQESTADWTITVLTHLSETCANTNKQFENRWFMD